MGITIVVTRRETETIGVKSKEKDDVGPHLLLNKCWQNDKLHLVKSVQHNHPTNVGMFDNVAGTFSQDLRQPLQLQVSEIGFGNDSVRAVICWSQVAMAETKRLL